jgi:hypothetical protein
MAEVHQLVEVMLDEINRIFKGARETLQGRNAKSLIALDDDPTISSAASLPYR